jgi:hypothetical protein
MLWEEYRHYETYRHYDESGRLTMYPLVFNRDTKLWGSPKADIIPQETRLEFILLLRAKLRQPSEKCA